MVMVNPRTIKPKIGNVVFPFDAQSDRFRIEGYPSVIAGFVLLVG
jgi:hypothetical protein